MTDTITAADYRRRYAKTMKERGKGQLHEQVVEIAEALNWKVMHINDRLYSIAAEQERWDALTGAESFPDLVLIRGNRLIVAECKVQNGEPTKEQQAWLDAFQSVFDFAQQEYTTMHVYVWRPSDLLKGRIHEILEWTT